MIIKALTDLYEVLAKQGRAERDGWMNKSVGWEICLDVSGNFVQIVNLKQEDAKGKLRQQTMSLPDWGGKRTSNVKASFLCDNSGFVLGISNKNKDTEDKLEKKRAVFCKLHHEILDTVDVPEAKAVLAFLDGDTEMYDSIVDNLDKDALIVDNFIFSVNGVRLHEIPEVCEAWDRKYDTSGEGHIDRCLVTGKESIIASTHPVVKGLRGAQASGAGLSTFNVDSFKSHGKNQNMNAPVGKHTAYAYTAALNYLLSDKLYCKTFGDDLTMVWWSEDADDKDLVFSSAALFGDSNDESKWTDSDISAVLDALSKGRPVDGLNPDKKFYILGLSPNASRIIVRFFIADTFGNVMANVKSHYDRLQICRSKEDDGRALTVNRLLNAMVRKDVNKEMPEVVTDKLFQSILFGYSYPVQMLSMTMRRMHSNMKTEDGKTIQTVNWKRIAIIKAYFLQTLSDNDKRKENFTVSLNLENRSTGYVLGRLFALYEFIQNKAIGTETIHNAYFSSAMTTPGIIIPRLVKLSQAHMRKLPDKTRIWYDKQISELNAMLDNYPARLNSVEQGAFVLGYYHQRADIFAKKADGAIENDIAVDTAESEE